MEKSDTGPAALLLTRLTEDCGLEQSLWSRSRGRQPRGAGPAVPATSAGLNQHHAPFGTQYSQAGGSFEITSFRGRTGTHSSCTLLYQQEGSQDNFQEKPPPHLPFAEPGPGPGAWSHPEDVFCVRALGADVQPASSPSVAPISQRRTRVGLSCCLPGSAHPPHLPRSVHLCPADG